VNILFLTLVWPEDNEHNIYTDLMEEFRDANHSVYVVAARERRVGKPSECSMENGIRILRVKCGNIQKTNPLEKGISSFLLGYQMLAAIKKHYSNIRFDLIIYSTPPITLAGAIETLKKKHNAKTYLLLKDIWPQGPVDMGVIKKGGLVWHYFRRKEKHIYKISDYIGCMSPANVRYVLEHNKDITTDKVEECPNSIKPRGINAHVDSREVRKKYGIPEDAVVFIFGGNLGKPQGVSFLIDAAEQIVNKINIFFVIVGSGSEFLSIKKTIKERNLTNILLIERLPKVEYEELCKACDVGLILLDKNFTIPNFPSRLLTYLDVGMPVLCATDKVCDMGDIVEKWECGIKTIHGDMNGFIKAIKRLAADKELREFMAVNARILLEKKYNARHSYEIISSHFKKRDY
jgi:glycosyltransferase involved in cell wall biosynthesis